MHLSVRTAHHIDRLSQSWLQNEVPAYAIILEGGGSSPIPGSNPAPSSPHISSSRTPPHSPSLLATSCNVLTHSSPTRIPFVLLLVYPPSSYPPLLQMPAQSSSASTASQRTLSAQVSINWVGARIDGFQVKES